MHIFVQGILEKGRGKGGRSKWNAQNPNAIKKYVKTCWKRKTREKPKREQNMHL
jgi:hypothetical protein